MIRIARHYNKRWWILFVDHKGTVPQWCIYLPIMTLILLLEQMVISCYEKEVAG